MQFPVAANLAKVILQHLWFTVRVRLTGMWSTWRCLQLGLVIMLMLLLLLLEVVKRKVLTKMLGNYTANATGDRW